MTSILNRLNLKGGFVHNVAYLAGGTAIGQGLIILFSPILTRLYRPEDFGMLAIYSSILSISAVGAALRYEIAIPLPKEDGDAANLLFLGLSIVLGMAFLSYILVVVFGISFVRLVKVPGLSPYLWILPFGIIGVGLYQLFNYWAVRLRAFPEIGRTKLIQSTGLVITQLGFGFFKMGPIGLLMGDLIGRFGGAGRLIKLAWQENKDNLKKATVQGMMRVAVRYKRFPMLSSFAAFCNSFGAELPILLMSWLYGSKILGWLALGQRVMVVPLSLIANAVGQVYFGESAKVVQMQPLMLIRQFWKMTLGLFAIACPYTLALAILGPLLFPIVFGGIWKESGIYVQIIAPMVLLQTIASPTGSTLDVLERQDLHLIREVTRIVLMSSAVFLAKGINAPSRIGIALLSAAGVVSYSSYILISIHAIRTKQTSCISPKNVS